MLALYVSIVLCIVYGANQHACSDIQGQVKYLLIMPETQSLICHKLDFDPCMSAL